MNQLFDRVFQYWPEWLILPWARVSIIIGIFLVLFIGAGTIRHYGLGLPVYERKTGDLATPARTLMTFLLISGGGAFFAVMGILIHRWKFG